MGDFITLNNIDYRKVRKGNGKLKLVKVNDRHVFEAIEKMGIPPSHIISIKNGYKVLDPFQVYNDFVPNNYKIIRINNDTKIILKSS